MVYRKRRRYADSGRCTGRSGVADCTTQRLLYDRARALAVHRIPSVDSACEEVASRFAARVDITTEAALLSAWSGAVDSYATIGMSEAYAIHRNWLVPYREQYEPIIWQRFTAAGLYPPEQLAHARARLQEVRRAWAQFFETYDFLVLPSVPAPAATKAECTPELRRGILTLTAPASLGGLPCLSLPVALPSGLSAGLQVILPAADSPAVRWIYSRCPPRLRNAPRKGSRSDSRPWPRGTKAPVISRSPRPRGHREGELPRRAADLDAVGSRGDVASVGAAAPAAESSRIELNRDALRFPGRQRDALESAQHPRRLERVRGETSNTARRPRCRPDRPYSRARTTPSPSLALARNQRQVTVVEGRVRKTIAKGKQRNLIRAASSAR